MDAIPAHVETYLKSTSHSRLGAARDLLVRNVYKVLLTGGLRGVFVRSTDEATHRFLESLVS